MDELRTTQALAAPVGEKGSGMDRYAAAMTLYQSHLIGGDTLEVFRICAPDDRLDPRGELIRLGITADIATLDRHMFEETQP